MKRITVTIFCSLLLVSVYAQPKAKIGMSVNEVKEIYPNTNITENDGKKYVVFKETIYGLEDEWGFRFEDETLDWIYFHHYINDFNKEKFDKCSYSLKSRR